MCLFSSHWGYTAGDSKASRQMEIQLMNLAMLYSNQTVSLNVISLGLVSRDENLIS